MLEGAMTEVENVSGVVACVDAIVKQYNDAATIIQQFKATRAENQAPAPSRYLEETIQCSPEDILKEKERGLGRYGLAFQQGDDAALKSLREVSSTLNTKLLNELHRLAQIDELADLSHLVDEADFGRDQTVGTLIRLRQRCHANECEELLQRSSSDASVLVVSPAKESPSAAPETTDKTYSFAQHHHRWFRNHRTQSTVRLDSRDVSGDEDTQAGAESDNHKKPVHPPAQHHGHNGLLSFLKHHRAHSHGDRTPEMSEDPRRLSRHPTTLSINERANTSVSSFDTSAAQQQSIWSHGYNGERLPEQAMLQRQSSELTHRDSQASDDTVTNISPKGQRSRAPSMATSLFRTSTMAVPMPMQENDYLGFCKGAVRLQNGDKRALDKRKGVAESWAHATIFYLACSTSKCVFAGHIDMNFIMSKIFVLSAKGLNYRWPFLAKSHVMQHKAKEDLPSFQCLFCVFSGDKTAIYAGTDAYLDHVSAHRGDIGAVTLYKTRCINTHIADDTEDFDINLFPLSADEARSRRASEMFSETSSISFPYGTGKNDSVIEASSEPWNAGLSDFHYRDEFYCGEIG